MQLSNLWQVKFPGRVLLCRIFALALAFFFFLSLSSLLLAHIPLPKRILLLFPRIILCLIIGPKNLRYMPEIKVLKKKHYMILLRMFIIFLELSNWIVDN